MKLWEVAVKDSVEPEIRKKIKRLLKPVLSVHLPGKCQFCGTDTTWTINNKPVCPACHVKYGFVSKDRIPDPCEVCGRQGEWCTEGDPIHSLCYIHRDAWFDWTREPFLPRGYWKLLENERDIAWQKAFAEFIQEMKAKQQPIL